MQTTPRPSDSLNIRSGKGQAQLDALEQMRGRVPLMDGWYACDSQNAIGWCENADEADNFWDNPNIEEVGKMRVLEHEHLTPADFVPLRDQYYASRL